MTACEKFDEDIPKRLRKMCTWIRSELHPDDLKKSDHARCMLCEAASELEKRGKRIASLERECADVRSKNRSLIHDRMKVAQ